MNMNLTLSTPEQTTEANDRFLTAMVEPDVQETLGRRYDPVQALLHGTLFPALFKPLANHQLPIPSRMIDDWQALSFALWELRLYLDTHPYDRDALTLLRQMDHMAEHPSYATAFLPSGTMEQPEGACACCIQYSWHDDPWPWEYRA